MNKLIVSPSPHDENYVKTHTIMLQVILALMPALGVGIYIFGPRVLPLTAVCVGSCILFEYVCRRLMKRDNTVGDMSAAVTGLLLAMNMPVTAPYWVAVIGSFVAIVIVKQLFGGIGQNFANPAITARIIMLTAFSGTMTNWVYSGTAKNPDAVSSATPLIAAAKGTTSMMPSYLDLFLGKHGGCLGETCAAAILLGGIYLLIRGVISWHTPVAFIATVALMSLVCGKDVLYQLLSGRIRCICLLWRSIHRAIQPVSVFRS